MLVRTLLPSVPVGAAVSDKKEIARLFELFCLERDIPLYGYGSMTCRREEKQRGLEADECYCRDRDGEVPDVALEVIVTTPLLDKLEVYRGLGVREVWIYRNGRFDVHALHGQRYERHRDERDLSGGRSGRGRALRGDARPACGATRIPRRVARTMSR